VSAEPHRPLQLRLLSLAHRAAHRLSGGRVGALEPGNQAPRGGALKAITALHLRLYRATFGLIGGSAGGFPTLLLTTTGRKTGQPRTVPLPYFPHPEGYAIVASFAGGPKNPAWYDNLVACPDVTVQVRWRRFRASAKPAGPQERAAIWPKIVAAAPNYGDYQAVAPREIPVVILRRLG
jgi:F420H(2)-dependent quinone reductase